MPPPSTSPGKRKLFRHPGRVAIVVVALVVVLNLGIVLLHNSDTSPGGREALPVAVQSISPERGEITSLVDTITVDLQDDLTGELFVNGQLIPDDQVERVPELGQLSFRPGADKDITHFRVGTNTVLVKYWSRKLDVAPADAQSFGWSFQAAA